MKQIFGEKCNSEYEMTCCKIAQNVSFVRLLYKMYDFPLLFRGEKHVFGASYQKKKVNSQKLECKNTLNSYFCSELIY